jgi:hypothetical protein
MTEEWKEVKGFPWYEVSNMGFLRRKMKDGSVRNLTYGMNIKGKGYVTVYMSNGKTLKQKLMHRVVAETFLGSINAFQVVNHKNEIKTDNRTENLEIVSTGRNISSSALKFNKLKLGRYQR